MKPSCGIEDLEAGARMEKAWAVDSRALVPNRHHPSGAETRHS